MMCVTEELMSPRILAPMKWAWLHSWDSSTLSLNPVKQRTRPSMLQEYTGRLLKGRSCDGEREREKKEREREGKRRRERERERQREREREGEREGGRERDRERTQDCYNAYAGPFSRVHVLVLV